VVLAETRKHSRESQAIRADSERFPDEPAFAEHEQRAVPVVEEDYRRAGDDDELISCCRISARKSIKAGRCGFFRPVRIAMSINRRVYASILPPAGSSCPVLPQKNLAEDCENDRQRKGSTPPRNRSGKIPRTGVTVARLENHIFPL